MVSGLFVEGLLARLLVGAGVGSQVLAAGSWGLLTELLVAATTGLGRSELGAGGAVLLSRAGLVAAVLLAAEVLLPTES